MTNNEKIIEYFSDFLTGNRTTWKMGSNLDSLLFSAREIKTSPKNKANPNALIVLSKMKL